jgi:hypothetical protein
MSSLDVNTPAVAWSWLRHTLTTAPAVGREWQALRDEHDGQGSGVVFMTDLLSDYWIATSQRPALAAGPLLLEQIWAIPEMIDDWPLPDLPVPAKSAVRDGSRSNAAALTEVLTATDPEWAKTWADPGLAFLELEERAVSGGRRSVDAVACNQVGSWIHTAVCPLLAKYILTPSAADSRADTSAAILNVLTLGAVAHPAYRDSLDYGCEALYVSAFAQTGEIVRPRVRQGQSAYWENAWHWMSVPQSAGRVEATVRLAGALLVNEPLLAGLLAAMQSKNLPVRRRALCVVRRWLLTTKVLTWLCEALRHNWVDVRPQDLACFAFAAMSPSWPRRAAAISHRSAEVKPSLFGLHMWKSSHVAIDATYLPAWETNIGMIWSLFSTVPLLVRVPTQSYHESEWCRREHELIQFLVDHKDFVTGRRVLDHDVAQLADWDQSWFAGASDDREFPPFSMTLVASVTSELDLALLRAGAAIRLINLHTRKRSDTNEIIRHLLSGRKIGGQPITHNPGGWAAYAAIFHDLRAQVAALARPGSTAMSPGRSPLLLPDDYPESEIQYDIAATRELPDLSDGTFRFADVLAATEWRRVVLTAFVDESVGDRVVVDVATLDVGAWDFAPEASIGRGLLALNTTTPTWIMQSAGQNAHTWPGLEDHPIFTMHSENQFDWIATVRLLPSWIFHYLKHSGLAAEESLLQAAMAAVVESAGPEAIIVEEDQGELTLKVPTPQEFFVINFSRHHWMGLVTEQTLWTNSPRPAQTGTKRVWRDAKGPTR